MSSFVHCNDGLVALSLGAGAIAEDVYHILHSVSYRFQQSSSLWYTDWNGATPTLLISVTFSQHFSLGPDDFSTSLLEYHWFLSGFPIH